VGDAFTVYSNPAEEYELDDTMSSIRVALLSYSNWKESFTVPAVPLVVLASTMGSYAPDGVDEKYRNPDAIKYGNEEPG
jgi:hypothetical protein